MINKPNKQGLLHLLNGCAFCDVVIGEYPF